MHRIESLELSGFKSFRHNSRILFTGDISAVVGPNGCGKSNICDAFLWVMGEQSAKALRGAKMDDVIFNGTQKHKPVSLAEVTLHLKYIPLPGEENFLSKEDIEIQRRIYREDAGEYYLNGKRCRLMDIQETFEGTGLGYTSYAIIEQGRIQDLISSKPLEKRALIEDAARIISFKHRKKAALMKLDLAQQNLLQGQIIILEIERAVKSLKTQVTRARRYKELREQMRKYLKLRFVLLGRSWYGLLAELDERIGRQDAELAQAEEAVRTGQDAVQHVRMDLILEEKKLESAQTQYNAALLEIQRVRMSGGHLAEQHRSLTERLEAVARETGDLEKRVDQSGIRREELSGNLELLEQSQGEAAGRFVEMERTYNEHQARLTERESLMEGLRAKVFDDAGRLSQQRNQETQLNERILWVGNQRRKLEEDLVGHRANQEKLERDVAGQEETLTMLGDRMAALDAEKETLTEEISLRRSRLGELKRRHQDMERHLGGLRHRLRSIEELETRNELYSDAVKKFLPHLASHPDFHGTLADHLEAGENFESVAENYLRESLETLVVTTESPVARGVEYVRDSRGGTFRFLLAEAASMDNKGVEPVSGSGAGADDAVRSSEGVMGRLLDMIRSVNGGETLLRQTIPGIEQVWLVRDWRTALTLARTFTGASFLSLDGVAVNPGGRITVQGAGAAKGVLGYRKEKRDLVQAIRQGERELQDLQEAIDLEQAALSTLEGQREEKEEAVQEFRIARVRKQEELKRRSEDLKRVVTLTRTAETELATVQADQERIIAQLAEIRERIADMEQVGAARRSEFETCTRQIAGLKEETQRLNREYADARATMGAARERLAAVRNELRQIQQSLEESGQRREALAEEHGRLQGRRETVEQELEYLRAGQDDAAQQKDTLEADVAAWKERITAIQTAISARETELEGRRAVREAARERRSASEVEKARLSNELSHLEEDAATEFHAPLAHLRLEEDPELAGMDAEEAQAEYLKHRDQVERMGAVNLVAVEEHDREQERLRFQMEQQKDIFDSIATTRAAIEEIDRRSAKMFKETFDAVNTNFQEMFRALFGGGSAELRLVDEENPLDSGVDIVASPPGKKLQNILLLSGGEKALTALALMLAVFKYRPSPFCILDEVDAPLDDSNIERFTNLIKGMSTQTQYILITHSKRTMEIADTIYGVTMEEPGISKVLSMQLREVEKVMS